MLADTLTRLFLLPPTNLFLAMFAAYLLRPRYPRAARALAGCAAGLLLVLTSGLGAMLLVRPLEDMTRPLTRLDGTGAQAIVVLGAGSIHRSPEYGGIDIPDEIALQRLRYGAHLQRATGLPLLVTGGNGTPDGRMQPKALGMARALREDFGVPVKWVEAAAADTEQNAVFSARILHAAGVRRVMLVTHAMHMPRASEAFRRAGLEVVEAPTGYLSRGQLSFMTLMPSAGGIYHSFYASHEWIGLLWYRLRRAGS